jgi:hypothetical protein
MSGWRNTVACLVVALLAGTVGMTSAMARGGAGAGMGAFGGGAIGGGGGGGSGLPPSITEPGWGRDVPECYQPRLVHTRHGAQWRRVWVCP